MNKHISKIQKVLIYIGLAIVWLLCLFVLSREYGWIGIDWYRDFRPAINLFWHGKSPYDIPGFYSPPWLLILLTPFAVLPIGLDIFAISFCSMLAFAYSAFKLGAKPWALAIFLFSPHVLKTAINGNVDSFICLGLFLPPPIGLFFLSLKPQLGFPVIIYIFISLWRDKGFYKIIISFLPIMILFGISLLIYGSWPLRYSIIAEQSWNIAPWPHLIPIGLAILVVSTKDHSPQKAFIAAPLLSPYMVIFSLPTVILGFLPDQIALLLAIIGFWILELYVKYPFTF